MTATAAEGTFAHLVQRAVDAATTPEKMYEKIGVHVGKLLDGTIRDALQWGDTAKAIKEAVKDSLQVNSLDLPSYGHVVTQILKRQIQARVAEVVAAKLAEDMEGLLGLAPKEASLSGLIAELLDGNSWDDGPDRVGLLIDGDFSSVWVYIARGELTDKYGAEVRLLVSLPKKFGEYKHGETIKGSISTGTVKGTDLKKDTCFGYGTKHKNQRTEFGRWFGFEQKILAMYAVGTVITLDEDDCVLDRHDY